MNGSIENWTFLVSVQPATKGKAASERQVAEFVNRACLRAEQLKLMYVTRASSSVSPGKRWKLRIKQPFFFSCQRSYMRGKQEMLERVFVFLFEGGEKRKKVTSPLMGSWWCHITTHRFFGLQVNQLICVLIGWPAPRGGGCFFFSSSSSSFPLASVLIPVPEWAHLFFFLSSLSLM